MFPEALAACPEKSPRPAVEDDDDGFGLEPWMSSTPKKQKTDPVPMLLHNFAATLLQQALSPKADGERIEEAMTEALGLLQRCLELVPEHEQCTRLQQDIRELPAAGRGSAGGDEDGDDDDEL